MNPLNNKQANISKGANETNEVAPVIERYAGQNIPYRGTQQHGITTDIDYPEIPDYSEESETYVEYPTEIQPVPVTIVNEVARERRAFRTFSYILPNNGQSVNVLGRDSNRSSVRIIAPDFTTNDLLYVSHEPFYLAGNAPAMGNAFPVRINQSILELHTEEPVHLATNDIDPVVVYILVEYTIPE